MTNKIWSTEQADRKFSLLIRERDKKCKRCGMHQSTDCSHFYERHNSSVRYSPENCVGLCSFCHDFFHRNRPEYKSFMLKLLGLERYVTLQRLSAITMKREQAILNFMSSLKQAPPDLCPMDLCDGSGKVSRDNDEVSCPHLKM